MRKRYQNEKIDTSQPAVPDTVSVKAMAIIILIIGAGGAFKQVIVDAGVADYIKLLTDGWNLSPILLAWGIAALLRVALGSATMAVVTAAGVVLPLVAAPGWHRS